MKRTIERRNAPEVNAGSMADIAFLLLIFFLVTTTIMSDSGLLVKLPPWDPNPPETDAVNSRNLFRVAINGQNQVSARGELIALNDLRGEIKTFIMNPAQLPNMAKAPNVAVVSLINDRSTDYETYLQVYNELKAAYNELWEAAAQQQFGEAYSVLPIAHQQHIRNEIPLVISEAEPTDFLE